jgi:hypothetical protein
VGAAREKLAYSPEVRRMEAFKKDWKKLSDDQSRLRANSPPEANRTQRTKSPDGSKSAALARVIGKPTRCNLLGCGDLIANRLRNCSRAQGHSQGYRGRMSPSHIHKLCPCSKSKELLVHRRRLVIDAKAVEVAQSKVGDREQLDAAQAAADALIAGKPDEKPDPEPEPETAAQSSLGALTVIEKAPPLAAETPEETAVREMNGANRTRSPRNVA